MKIGDFACPWHPGMTLYECKDLHDLPPLEVKFPPELAPATRVLQIATGDAIEAVEVEVIPPAFTWESQACQYGATGEPGISYERHYADGGPDTGPENPVDCLLLRNVDGLLIGILNHYPEGASSPLDPAIEKPGAINVWANPARRRIGVATLLIREARQRWGVDWRQQRYTEEGLCLLKALLEKDRL